MGTYGKPRLDHNGRFVRNLGVAILVMGVLVFVLWFCAITGTI
jgi:hypothetical protein